MRVEGIFRYFLMENKAGYMISQVEVPYELKDGDEINFKGNKLLIKEVKGDVAGVEKIGSALVVEPVGTKEQFLLPKFNTSVPEICEHLFDNSYDMEIDNEELAYDLEMLSNWLRIHNESFGSVKDKVGEESE